MLGHGNEVCHLGHLYGRGSGDYVLAVVDAMKEEWVINWVLIAYALFVLLAIGGAEWLMLQ